MNKALTIAGFDPSGGAGLQADLKVFQSVGVYGLSAVAALTAQNTKGVFQVLPVTSQFLKKQLDVLLSDIVPDSVKIGMLLTAGNVRAVAEAVARYSLKNIVLDPVFVSSSGVKLAAPAVPPALVEKILPLCRVITPNMHEASVLSGIYISTVDDMKRAAEILRNFGPEVVIITGGHLEGEAVDVVYDGSFNYLKAKKRQGEYHGTGCIFSSAIAAFLARDNSAIEAAKKAKKFITKAFEKTTGTQEGMKLFTF